MKLLTCASYYCTGSSAVTDLINECDNVHFMGDYEFRFIQDPHGICDLEYNLVLNNHRHNSGYAIKQYEKMVNFLNGNRIIKKYNQFFGEKWIEYSNEYVKNLIAVEYKGYWHQDLYDKGMIAYILERVLNKLMHSVFHIDSDRNYTLFMNKTTNYATFPLEDFYFYTREYIDKLFEYANDDKKEYIMIDQAVPASNTMHYLRFFNDLKVICVDRDPRDIYILEKEVYHGAIVPRDVKSFCIWYKATRSHRKYEKDDPTKIMRINFEDLIYDYEKTSGNILSFCGIGPEHHTMKMTRLIPEKSKRNTMVYRRFLNYKEDVRIIEHELKEYLYEA